VRGEGRVGDVGGSLLFSSSYYRPGSLLIECTFSGAIVE
jgi:hypothetical protein